MHPVQAHSPEHVLLKVHRAGLSSWSLRLYRRLHRRGRMPSEEDRGDQKVDIIITVFYGTVPALQAEYGGTVQSREAQ